MDKGLLSDTLKDVQESLVKKVGGILRAEKLGGHKKSIFQRYMDRNNPAHMPVHQVAMLERAAGEPIVTRELARLAGYELVKIDEPLPFASPDAFDVAVEIQHHALAAVTSVHAWERGQKSPRALQTVIGALRRKQQAVGRMIDMFRLSASKQRETA